MNYNYCNEEYFQLTDYGYEEKNLLSIIRGYNHIHTFWSLNK